MRRLAVLKNQPMHFVVFSNPPPTALVMLGPLNDAVAPLVGFTEHLTPRRIMGWIRHVTHER